jgi:hypothetical protein
VVEKGLTGVNTHGRVVAAVAYVFWRGRNATAESGLFLNIRLDNSFRGLMAPKFRFPRPH